MVRKSEREVCEVILERTREFSLIDIELNISFC